jgi:hypothetical protein
VPVLTARRGDGVLAAIVFGYACHSTVLGTYEWSGDYPGFTAIELEQRHPSASALYFAGCGADQNPLPRRTVEFAQEYGRMLARSVNDVVLGVMTPIDGELVARYTEIPLAFGTLPTREEIEKDRQSNNKYIAERARVLLERLDQAGSLEATYPYPVQFWRLGRDLGFVTLGGEVVVDYSLRLKRELGRKSTWVAAYANDVMAYIPSLRVLNEGGYEGGGAMVYYGLPAPWGPDVEESIMRAVHLLAQP